MQIPGNPRPDRSRVDQAARGFDELRKDGSQQRPLGDLAVHPEHGMDLGTSCGCVSAYHGHADQADERY